MKRHGLWQWHRIVRKTNSGVRWWEGGESLQVACNHVTRVIHYGEYRSADAITRCAYRAMRRYKLPMRAGVYVDICKQIASRTNAHHRSICSAISQMDELRRKAPIYFVDEVDGVRSNCNTVSFLREEQKERRIARLARETERDKLCCVCKKKKVITCRSTYLSYKGKTLLGLDDVLRLRPGKYYGYSLCWSCWMHLSKMVKKAEQADRLRIETNQTRRKLYEITKNHARAA